MNCVFTGTLLEHLTNIISPDSCQLACKHYQGCEYFFYDSKQNNCELRLSGDRECDFVRGAPSQMEFKKCVKEGLIKWPWIN